MYFIEAVSHLIFLLAKAIVNVAIEATKNLYSLKSIVVVISAALSLYINIVWIKRVNLKKHLILPIVYLTVVNLILIATSIEIEALFSFDIELAGANMLCKILKWIQSTCLILSTGLIIYITNIFRHPQTFQNKIKEKINMILVITPILTFPQIHLFKTYVGTSNNGLLCTVDIPDEASEFVARMKLLLVFVLFLGLLLLHLFLFKTFNGTQASFFRRAEIKMNSIETYCVVNGHFLIYYLVLSTISYFFPILKHLVECFHSALLESGRFLSIFIPFIITGILDKTPMEEITGNRRFRKNLTSSSSSFDTDSIELSDDEENIVTDTDRNFNPNAVVP